jgi:hypothetical protein
MSLAMEALLCQLVIGILSFFSSFFERVIGNFDSSMNLIFPDFIGYFGCQKDGNFAV